MEQTPKVSVIIPVYNAEKYLRQCLDSVVNQTLREIEIICVDDGSTDGSLAILQEYAANDARVKVLTQKNQYAGVARNNGMAAATGEYYVFWDADDFFELDTLQLEYEHCEKYHADICLCGADQFNEKTAKYEPMPWVLEVQKGKKSYNRTSCEDIFRITSPCPWSKMFSAAFVRKWHLLFQPLPLSNDVYFTLSALALADNIVTVNRALIHYRVGISTNLQSHISKKPTAICEALLAVRRKLEAENCWKDVERSFFNCALGNLRHNLERSGESKNDFLYELSRYYWHEIGFSSHDKNYFAMPGLYEQISKMVADAHPPAPVYTKIGAACTNNSITPKVSVIIPVYNTERFLPECLNSILEQTLQEIQVICVNDGSWDNSLQILEEYASKDSRITIISQENMGQSAARNAALKISTGRYVCMVDSDDMLEKCALEELYKYADAQSLDILFFEADSIYMNQNLKSVHAGYSTYYKRKNDYGKAVSGANLFTNLVINNEYRVSPCLQLIRRLHLLQHNILFPVGIVHEDNLFTFENLLQADRAAVINKPYYIRRIREDSVMTRAPGFANVYGYLICYAHMLAFVLQHKLDSSTLQCARTVIDGMRQSAQNTYCQLSKTEKEKVSNLNAIEMLWFETVVLKPSKKEIAYSLPENPGEAALIRASASYRIGRFITWIPRKVRGLFRCCREHGWRYTCKRVLVHLHLK